MNISLTQKFLFQNCNILKDLERYLVYKTYYYLRKLQVFSIGDQLMMKNILMDINMYDSIQKLKTSILT